MKARTERKRERAAFNRFWFKVKPTFKRSSHPFHSEQERRHFEAHLRRMHLRASLRLPV